VVPAAERLDEPAVRAQQRLALVGLRVSPDHRLAAAQIQAGQGVLVRHRTAEVEHVGEGGLLALVRVEPRAAEGGAEGGRVDGDDGPEPARRVLAEDNLFVAGALAWLAGGEDAHCLSLTRSVDRPSWGRVGSPARSAPALV